MKIFKKITFILFMALAFASCSSDDDNNGGGDDDMNNSGEEFFRAKVEGADWSADTDLASLIGGFMQTSNGMTTFQAQGSTNEGSFINITILGYNGPGTYVVADDNLQNANSALYGASPAPENIYVSNSIIALGGGIRPGEIVVTSQDDNGAQGTFSFEGFNDNGTRNVTDGEFKIVFDN